MGCLKTANKRPLCASSKRILDSKTFLITMTFANPHCASPRVFALCIPSTVVVSTFTNGVEPSRSPSFPTTLTIARTYLKEEAICIAQIKNSFTKNTSMSYKFHIDFSELEHLPCHYHDHFEYLLPSPLQNGDRTP